MRDQKPDREVSVTVENIVEKSHPINRRFGRAVQLFAASSSRCNEAATTGGFKTCKPNDSELGWKITKPHLNSYVAEQAPDVLVSVHPMCNQYLARAIKETGLKKKTKLVTVVTDPNGILEWLAVSMSDLSIVQRFSLVSV